MAVIDNPTYMGHIRDFFRPGDISCMKGPDSPGIELGTYLGVKLNAQRIINVVHEQRMPPDGPWPDDWLTTFSNWVDQGCPRGVAEPIPWPDPPQGERIRNDVASIEEGSEDHQTLVRAFEGMRSKLVHDPDGYFYIAGIHWLPGPDRACRHHENAYNPWHREYLRVFEDAMRKIPGCEEVTLPYWDIRKPVPEWLGQAPFDSYQFPVTMESLTGARYEAGQSTTGSPLADIPGRVAAAGIPKNIADAMAHSRWERFNGWVDAKRTQDGIILAHDRGHNAAGISWQQPGWELSLTNQDIASFHPLFWFFHCNWDRLWWEWQKLYRAHTLEGFKTTLEGGADWIEDKTQNRLDPFGVHVDETINLAARGIDYAAPTALDAEEADFEFVHAPLVAGHAVPSEGAFTLREPGRASVRVKGVDRLAIRSSFEVRLLAGDHVLATEFFFQSTDAESCTTCRKKGAVNFDFVVPISALQDAPITVEVHGRTDTVEGSIPLSACGDPTMNIRLLVEPA